MTKAVKSTWTDFGRDPAAHIKRLRETGEPAVLRHAGRPAAIVMSINAYRRLAADALVAVLDRRAADKQPRIPLDAAFRRLRARSV